MLRKLYDAVNVILQKYMKSGGRGRRRSLRQLEFSFDARLFVCYLFLRFCFCFLFVCSFSSVPFKGTTSVWIEYRITSYYITRLCLFVHVDLLCDHFCAGREKFQKLKANGVGLLRCHVAVNNDGATLSCVTV